MRWDRKQYLDHMTFTHSDGELLCSLFGPLIGLEDEWRSQGATPSEIDLSAFGFDYVNYEWLPVNVSARMKHDPVIIKETEREVWYLDELGRTTHLVKFSATIPLPSEYPVKTPDDWERVKPFYLFHEDRVDTEALKRLKKKQENGTLILGAIPGGFDEPRSLMGEEALCYAVYDEPEMIQDMLDTFSKTALAVYDRVTDILTVDNLSIHEDMAGRSGPLMGKRQIRQFISPYYHSVIDELKLHGTRLFSQDSDGDMTPVVQDFLDAGLNMMYPCEPQAGMDAVALRKQFGNALAFKGTIDKMALRGTKEDIRRELEYKLQPCMLGGGTIFGIDHLIPNGVPIENFRYYVETAREMLGKPFDGAHEYVRMAF